VPLASVLPLVLAAAVAPGWSLVVWTAVLFFGTEAITGQAIEPVLYGRSTGLSPAAVIIAAIFWTWLWGPIGLLLSTPLTLCMVVLGRHFKRLEFLAVLLGDRPALSPVESFYQRMLAGDPDEAEDQAEILLRDMPLSSYYDESALPGLQLAAADAARGVLRTEQIDRLMQAAEALMHDLDDHDDGNTQQERLRAGGKGAVSSVDIPDPPCDWAPDVPILCVAGRGPLDAAPAAMLAQLLGKHGLVARALPHDAVSRTQAGNLDAEGFAMLCIVYLEIIGTPAHLRFLLRRLRQRFPGRPILVGLWPAPDEIVRDARLRESIGADYYAGSLRQA
ncbi:MAG: AI-2E family transporter, partial [Acetobacteraceae bacterium]